MKKIIIVSLVSVFLMGSICVAETTRDDLYASFGPVLIEAVVKVIKDEINIIRTELNLPERTNQQLFNAIETKLDSLAKYDWMSN